MKFSIKDFFIFVQWWHLSLRQISNISKIKIAVHKCFEITENSCFKIGAKLKKQQWHSSIYDGDFLWSAIDVWHDPKYAFGEAYWTSPWESSEFSQQLFFKYLWCGTTNCEASRTSQGPNRIKQESSKNQVESNQKLNKKQSNFV